MKRTLLAAAIPAILLSTAAHAQSSVTLYGLIDEGFDFTSNGAGHRGYEMVSGDAAGSRWGLKGSEDLGNGLKGIFLLENGFNTNTGQLGQGGLEFGRQAYVGLSSVHYGTFTMGRQYDPTVDMWSGFTAAGNTMGDLAAHPFDNDNADWDYRIQNSVKYVSPTYAGFTGEAMYGFSNQAGAFANNRMYSAAGTYKMGGFAAALAYMKTDNGGANASGAASNNTTVFTADSQQNIDAGVSYTFSNNAMLAFAYSHVDVYNPTANPATARTQNPSTGASESEFLHGRTKHNLVDIDIGRLFDRVRDSASHRVGRNRLLIKLPHHLRALFMRAAEFQFGIDSARQNDRRADRGADFVPESFGDSAYGKLGAAIDGAAGAENLDARHR